MRRQPLVALALSLMMPGLGQVYSGELAKGMSLFVLFALAGPVFAYVAVYGPAGWMALSVLAGAACAIGLYAYGAWDAYVSAKRADTSYRLQSFNRPVVYAAMLLAGYLLVLAPTSGYVTGHMIQAFRVPTPSMQPNVLPGDRFFVDKRINTPGGEPLRRGDIVVFAYPNDRTTLFVKRIVGLPGDRIEILENQVLLNGVSIRAGEVADLGSDELNRVLTDRIAYRERGEEGTYVVLWNRGAESPPLVTTIPAGQVFVLGDDRGESLDSRDFGPVDMTDLVGIARQVWLSTGEAGVRFHRIGARLDVGE